MDLSSAKPARRPDSYVFPGKTEFLFAVRALGVHVGLCDRWVCWIQSEICRAEFALHALAQVLSVDLQLLRALWATDEHAGWCNLNHDINLLQGDERGNFDAIPLKLRIQQGAAFPAVNHIRRHILATVWAGPPRPSRHITSHKNAISLETQHTHVCRM